MQQAFKELADFCKGEQLSLATLREKLAASPEGTIRAHGLFSDDTLLHHVCYSTEVTLEIVEFLVGLYPEAVEHVTDNEWIPLHLACLNECCPNSVVEFLVGKYPDSLSISWPPAGLPLHCLLYGRDPWESDPATNDLVRTRHPLDLGVVGYLVERYPDALTNRENCKRATPLLMACERDDVSLDFIKILVDEDFAALRLVDRYNQLPFHQIFQTQGIRVAGGCPSPEIVQFFLEYSPDTLNATDVIRGNTPFHDACRNEYVSLEIIQLFLQRRHDLLQQQNEAGLLPLHSMCVNNHSSDSDQLAVVKYIVEQYPEAVRTRNSYGLLPLMCATDQSLELTEFLVERYPEAVRRHHYGEGLPFHRACQNGSIEVVKFLYGLYPEAISMPLRAGGDLPIHLVFAFGRDVAAKIQFLTDHFPDSVKVLGESKRLPLHCACMQYRPDLSVIKFLFELHPEAIHARAARGFLPLHCLCDRYTDPPKEIIQFLVKQLPYSTKAKDSEGRVPLHYACKNFSLEGLKDLIGLCPDAVRVESPTHGLPIPFCLQKSLRA